MRVLYLRSNPVDPDPRVEKEVNSLIKFGHQVTILAWDRSCMLPRSDLLVLDSGQCKILRFHAPARYGAGLRSLFSIFRFQIFLLFSLFRMKDDYDVVHAADFDTVLPGAIAKLLFKKKLVYDIFDFYVDAFNVPRAVEPFVRFLDLKTISFADCVILTSEWRRDQISGATPKKVYFIHNTPDSLRQLRSQLNFTANAKFSTLRFAYVGVLQPDRLILEILEIFERHSNWILDIAGFGILESEVQRICHGAKNIRFHGKVSYERAIEISDAADILFATYNPRVKNHRFSSPNKLYEAMMLGKPIIVCESTGIDKLVVDHEIGFSIPYDANEFEVCASNIINEQIDIGKMGSKSRMLYEQDFSWHRMEARLVELYNKI
jgi:glycosyltransferase involved in cell wall biosynthesis